jgi:hypothetical protein
MQKGGANYVEASTMSPYRLKNSVDFTPDDILAMRQTFDAVWERIAPTIKGANAASIEAARSKLADAVLTAARDDIVSTEDLTRRVLDIVFKPPHSL